MILISSTGSIPCCLLADFQMLLQFNVLTSRYIMEGNYIAICVKDMRNLEIES
jgi:hypothetical protein